MNKDTCVKLCCDTTMPIVALGVWKSGENTKQAVLDAIDAGYRHIDTAAAYHNEEAVGEAIKESGIKREDLFITTKLWNEDIRKHRVREALMDSLHKLQLDYVDLYLMHWPAEGYVEAYLEMEKLKDEGYIKAIGVSNFRRSHLENLLANVHKIPSVDQLEINPQFQDLETMEYCKENKIRLEAWSPLGSGSCLYLPEIERIAAKHQKSTAQIILRWLLQKGIVVLPKSVHKERIIENINLFDFELTETEMLVMDHLNIHKRTGPDPDHFNF